MLFNSSPQKLREKGKELLARKNRSFNNITKALKLLKKAANQNDIESIYLYADLVMKGYDGNVTQQRKEQALGTMLILADDGYTPARVYLDKYSNDQYKKDNISSSKYSGGPLKDFYGIPIEIKKAGNEFPIDGVLEYKGGKNTFTLSANVRLECAVELLDKKRFLDAVIEGMKAWEGEYTVFGGQQLTVKLNITTDDRQNDNLCVIPVTPGVRAALKQQVRNTPNVDKANERALIALLDSKRSFFMGYGDWRVNGQKSIFLQFPGDVFGNFPEIKDTVKHEFGHAIGLGDLYPEMAQQMSGVRKGEYRELDSYYIAERVYNLVMCDYHGPISNNDIEMVLLAFRTNRMQHYQSRLGHGVASNALGRGN